MIKFLLGVQGTGKSTYIIEEIKRDCEANQKSILLVPEQQTLVSERELAINLSPKAQLLTEATNFTRLANSVFRQVGGIKYNYVRKSECNLIMYKAICQVRDLLKHYSIPHGREKACIGLFLQAIGELKSYCVTAAMLENVLTSLENQVLKDRINDLILIWSAYDAILKNSFDDPYDDLLLLEKKLEECEYFKDTNVYIDSFYGFTKSQLNIVCKILRGAKNVTIALDCPHDATPQSMQYKRIASTFNTVYDKCKGLDRECISFTEDRKHKSEAISYLYNNIWKFDAPSIEKSEDVSLALAQDELEECEYICSQIKRLVSGGSRYSDIAIIGRNISSYQGIIDYCLDKFNIPYHMSSPSKLLTKPVIKMIFSAISAIGSFGSEDIVRYAKCGYLDVDQEDLCYFEGYINRWSIYGKKFKNDDYWSANPEGYQKKFTDEQKAILSRVLRVRTEIIKKLSIIEEPFIKGENVQKCATALYEFLNAHRVMDKLREEIKNEDREEAAELIQVWRALVRALDSVVKVCGDTVCDIDTFATLLNYSMMDAKIGTIPQGEDRVTVADASLVRAKNIDHVFVLEVNEGAFPALVDDTSFFTDRDKVELESNSIELSAKSEQRGDDELLFFKNAIGVASLSATVLALKKDLKGSKREPSIAFARVKALFDGIDVIDISSLPIENTIYTPEIARELYGAACEELKLAIRELTHVNTDIDSFDNDEDKISAEFAKNRLNGKLNLSKSSMEAFVKCRFNYYCSYILKLKEWDKIKFSHRDIGFLVHSVFEHFLKLGNVGKKDYKDTEIYDTVTRLTDEYTRKVCGVRAASNKMRHFFSRLKLTVCVFVKELLNEMKHTEFVPTSFELTINGDGEKTPKPMVIKLNDEVNAVLAGEIDRLDVYRDIENQKTYVKLFDYKTGNYSFSLNNVTRCLDMQMLIYLLALCKMDECEFKEKLKATTQSIEAAGFVFLSYSIDSTKVDEEIDLSSEERAFTEEGELVKKISRSGLELNDESVLSKEKKYQLKGKSLITNEEFTSMLELVKSNIVQIGLDILSGDATPSPIKGEEYCKHCKSYPICRSKRRVKNEW